MVNVYFVRHAQPVHEHKDNRTRPLSEEGMADRQVVLDFLKDKEIDAFYCSPYKRSIDTIAEAAKFFKKEIITDERFRERKAGEELNWSEMLQRRWDDFDFHEDGGESLRMVQERNMEALFEVLDENDNKSIVIGTHGTALSTILNYYDSSFNCDSFLRIIDWMPYIIQVRFDGHDMVDKVECVHIYKEFKLKNND